MTILNIILLILFIAKTIKIFVDDVEGRYRKLLSQKKSSEVVLGQISETLAPFLDSFPKKEEAQGLCFLGMPIDYIHFGDDEITFIEVKSGGSQLSSKQRKIKKLIEDKKVSFLTHRIS